VFIWLIAAACLGVVLIDVTHGRVKVVGVLAAIALVTIVAARARRIGVWADSERVVVQNFWMTHEFFWADVVRVKAFQGSRSRAWVFEMRDGHRVWAQALPFMDAFSATHRLASVARIPIEIDTGGSRPQDA